MNNNNSQDIGKQTADQLGQIGKSAVKNKNVRRFAAKGFKAAAKFLKFFISKLIPALIKTVLSFIGPYLLIIIVLIVLLLIVIDGVASFDFFQMGGERNKAEELFDNTIKTVVVDRTEQLADPLTSQIRGQQDEFPYPPVSEAWLQKLTDKITPSWAMTGILYSYKNLKHVNYRPWHKDFSNTAMETSGDQNAARTNFYNVINKEYDYYFNHPSMQVQMTMGQSSGEKVDIREETTCTYEELDEEGNVIDSRTETTTKTRTEPLPSREIVLDATLLYSEAEFAYYWHDTEWIDSGETASENCSTKTFKKYHLYLIDDGSDPPVTHDVNRLLSFLLIDNPQGKLARLVKVKDLEYVIDMAQSIDENFPKFTIDYKGLKSCAKGGNISMCIGQFVTSIGAFCSPDKEINESSWNSTFAGAGVLSSYGSVVLEKAKKHGIDPVIFAAIAFHESGFGTSPAIKEKNNPGGLMGKNGLMIFSTLDDGLESMARTLHNRIINDGLTTIEKLGSKYAPVGASNDPTGLNNHWVPNVSKIVAQLGGLTMNCESYGDHNGGFPLPVGDETFMTPSVGRISSNYGPRWGRMHYGVDIAKKGAGVPIVAAADGEVSRSRRESSYGNVVFIRHNINGNTYETVYAHMSERKVTLGDKVTKGQLIGFMGNTGNSTGQHLHFEIHRPFYKYQPSNSVNPLLYIAPPSP